MSDQAAPPLTSVFDAVQQRMAHLVAQRDALLRQLQEIEEKVAAVAEALGIDPATMARPLAEAPKPKIDGRRAGSMVEYMVNAIRDAKDGITRGDLKAIVRASPEHGEKVRKSENGFYNAITRLLRSDELVDVGGRLFVAGFAPKDTEAAATRAESTLFDREGGNA